ncbi:MAG: tRNA lysidine(34) synthetase TilS, partial [Candidatus Omnitrophica bacterium]|nr:tRNA lysidine(34) synthetase TilS [Candidatus Omnitrophota bacterium]
PGKRDRVLASRFLTKVRHTIEHYGMMAPGDRVIVAVSGGPDSVALLAVMSELGRRMGLAVIVANLDHGIRAEESRQDSAFVRDLALKMGMPFEHRELHLGKGASGGLSLEERAREARYLFLKEAAVKNGCSVICTGHTMDDQSETVLMRVIKGTSLSSLAGIKPIREEAGLRIVRPLIRVTKSEIIAYLEAAGLSCVTDSTNQDVDLFRNAVRLEVLPFLEKYNPGIRRSLVNLADEVRDGTGYAASRDAAFMGIVNGDRQGAVTAAVSEIILQPKVVRKAIFKELLRRAGGELKKLTYHHWMDMDVFLKKGRNGSSLDLPGDIRVTRNGDIVTFSLREREQRA